MKMPITYDTFLILYKQAKMYDDIDLYVADRGWQDWWMDDIGDIDEITSILYKIYDFRFATVKDLREALHISQARFATLFDTSNRNVERWESGDRAINKSLISLMTYVTLEILWKADKGAENGNTKE